MHGYFKRQRNFRKKNKKSLKKTILIIGGSGFIGQNLIRELNFSKYKVISASRNIPKKCNKFNNIKYISVDVSKKSHFKRIKNKIDIVINLGGNINHSNKKETYNSHFIGCKNLVNYFKDKSLQIFIQIGSSLEYGKVSNPHKEQYKCKPNSHYGMAKLKATNYLKKSNLPYVILRLYQVYGPFQKKNRVIPNVVDSLIKEKTFRSTNGKQIRDFLYVSDLVSLIKIILRKKSFNYGVYNVGSGKGIQVKKILTQAKLMIQKGNIEFGSAKMRKDELLKNYPNIQKVRKEFNWSSKFSIKKGLRHTIKFYEKN